MEKGATARKTGFTLIEVIASLVLIGIISTFASVFLVRGIEGYLFTREAADTAFKAQIALNRISLEFRSISTMTAPVIDTSISYTSDKTELAGSRTIKFDANTLYISVGGTDYILFEGVSAPQLSAGYDDMNNDGSDEVAYIDAGFTVGSLPAFNIRVYPRNMIAKTW
jgi:prepilin-type N-terminal cleavage/methylation domain-containing protein